MFEFLKIDDDFWEFPFYSGIPKISKLAWGILIFVVFLEILMIFGVLSFLPLYLIPEPILGILPCVILLLALAYACKGKLGMFFKKLTMNDVKIIIVFYILSMIYTPLALIALTALGVPTSVNTAVPMHSIFPMITNGIVLLISLMEEELFKVIMLILLMAAIYYFTKNKKLSVTLGIFLNLIIFGLCHLTAYNGNIIQCIVVIGFGSFFNLYVYLKTKNILSSFIVHVLYDFLFDAIGFLLSLHFIGFF